MDLRTALIVSALVLSAEGFAELNETEKDVYTPNINTSNLPTIKSAVPVTPTPSVPRTTTAPALGLIYINWTGDCVGDVLLLVSHRSASSSHICSGSQITQSVFQDVCQSRKGCKGALRWKTSQPTPNGSYVKDGREERRGCSILQAHCEAEAGADTELQAYKVMVGLLVFMLLLVLMIRFTKPTIKALQKRLSDRRQNRWIGPTQSHSVSYQRGKSAIKNNDADKRSSYPALERLTVSNSREPSSNRNSGYTF